MDCARRRHLSTVPVAAWALVLGCAGQPAAPRLTQPDSEERPAAFDLNSLQGPADPFADLAMFFEFNSTDNDLGVQVFLDADAWDLVSATSPDHRSILQIMARNELGHLGLTELRFESAEPSPAAVLGRFPPGHYQFRGRSVERPGMLAGTATLSHVIPPAPVISPQDGAEVDPANTVISWEPIPGLAGYEVIVSNEDNGRSMTVELGPGSTSLRVPVEFMESGADYKAEVLAIHPNGNKTITETTFSTS